MSVVKLFVEGKLDAEIYTSVFFGKVTIVRGGSKNSIRPQAQTDRDAKIQAGYLRDRDFDFHPPEEMNVPTVDASIAGQPWGWRLNRHEIESYLIDPQIVKAKFGIPAETWQSRIVQTAKRIRWYQIARWTVGYARNQLPPHYKLQTKPESVRDFRLPNDLTEQASLQWCQTSISKFRTMITDRLSDEPLEQLIERRKLQLSDDSLADHQHALTWCSGKDLFAGLAEKDLQDLRVAGRKELCNILRDWVRDHPEEFHNCFPEFAAILQQMTRTATS